MRDMAKNRRNSQEATHCEMTKSNLNFYNQKNRNELKSLEIAMRKSINLCVLVAALLLVTGCSRNLDETKAKEFLKSYFEGMAVSNRYYLGDMLVPGDKCINDLLVAGDYSKIGDAFIPSNRMKQFHKDPTPSDRNIELFTGRYQINSVKIRQVENAPVASISFSYDLIPLSPIIPSSCIDIRHGKKPHYGEAVAQKLTSGWEFSNVKDCGSDYCFYNFERTPFVLQPTAQPATPNSNASTGSDGWASIGTPPMDLRVRPAPPFSTRPVNLEAQGKALLYKGGPNYFRVKKRVPVFERPDGDSKILTHAEVGQSFIAFEAWVKVTRPSEVKFNKAYEHKSESQSTTYQPGQVIYGYFPWEYGCFQLVFDPIRPNTTKSLCLPDDVISVGESQEVFALHVRLTDKREGWTRGKLGADAESLEYDPATWKSAKAVSIDKTNVRSSADEGAGVVTQLTPDQPVLVLPINEKNWWEVRTADGAGWLGYVRRDRLVVDQ